MNPIFNEYLTFLRKTTNEKLDDLKEGYFWLDNQIIKGFDKQGNIHKFYRVNTSDDLQVTLNKPKNYDNINDVELISWNELVDMNSYSIRERERESLELINSVLNQYKDYSPQILISGGKDSSVTMHLVRKANNTIYSVFNNTTLDCADTYIYVKQIDNVQTINPKEGFYQWRQRLNFVPTRFSRACCSIFKEGAMMNVLPHENKYMFFLGMRNEESDKRSNYEDMWNNPKWCDNWKGCLPIRKWTELDVWLYILMENISFNPKYKKGYARVGCAICCPFASKSTWILDKYWYSTMRNRWEEILKDDFITNKKWIILNCTINEYINQAWNGGVFRDEPTKEVIQEYADYNNLDYNIAERYFNKYCENCSKKIKQKDVVGMNMKLHGRNVNKFYCKKCLMNMYGMDKEEWDNEVNKFKMQGCDLF